MLLQETIKTALEHIKHIAKTETIFGEPVNAAGVTIIPVSKVSVGFAAGGAGKDPAKHGAGAGTGGGVNVTPVAIITISGGDVKVIPLGDGELDIEKLLSLAPDAVRKIVKFFKRKKDNCEADDQPANADANATNTPSENENNASA